MNKSLTLNEKFTVSLSIIAIIISIVSPFTAYYFLQSSVREEALKAQSLKASGSFSYRYVGINISQIRYSIDVANTGELPINNVFLSFRNYDHSFSNELKNQIETDPPVPFQVDLTQNILLVHLKNVLLPQLITTISFSIETDSS